MQHTYAQAQEGEELQDKAELPSLTPTSHKPRILHIFARYSPIEPEQTLCKRKARHVSEDYPIPKQALPHTRAAYSRYAATHFLEQGMFDSICKTCHKISQHSARSL